MSQWNSMELHVWMCARDPNGSCARGEGPSKNEGSRYIGLCSPFGSFQPSSVRRLDPLPSGCRSSSPSKIGRSTRVGKRQGFAIHTYDTHLNKS